MNTNLSDITDIKTILGGVTAGSLILTSAGLVPQVGLVRAFVLGWKSIFSFPNKISVRQNDIKALSKSISTLSNGNYIVVTGEKGYGKTCLIQTTGSGESEEIIVEKARKAITGIHFSLWDLKNSSKRVLWFYHFMFRSYPIVVIEVPERTRDEKYASITGATRELADKYNLRVVIDGLPNSLPPEIMTTTREIVYYIEEMDKAEIQKIEEFERLITFLKKNNLFDAVWEVIGGVPSLYILLRVQFINNGGDNNSNDESTRKILHEIVKTFITVQLRDALHYQIFQSNKNTQLIINHFREKKVNELEMSELEALGITFDYSNKVFRTVTTDSSGAVYVIPATPAVGLIIRENVFNGDDILLLVDKLVGKVGK